MITGPGTNATDIDLYLAVKLCLYNTLEPAVDGLDGTLFQKRIDLAN
jgi:hypothetical protein